jgi:hypothetical protein
MIVAISLLTVPAHAQPARPAPQVGDTYEIIMRRQSADEASDGSGGDSTEEEAVVERVIGVRDDGLELEYELTSDRPAADRAAAWQLPARIFRPFRGQPQLLNGPQLETRLEAWLRRSTSPRYACRRWPIAWDAFRTECGAQSALQAIELLDMASGDLQDGAAYRDVMALAPALLRRTSVGPNGATFIVELPVDPETIRRTRVEFDMDVADLAEPPLTREASVRTRSAETISGSITVTLETDPAGHLRRRIRVQRLEIREPSGRVETQITTETTQRRRLSSPRT